MNQQPSSGFISLPQAIEMTARYRQNRNTILASQYTGKDILSICDTFNKEAIETILKKPGCCALRLYYGMDENMIVRPIMVAVNEKDEDMLPAISTLESGEEDKDIVDDTIKCPPICPPPSPLNS
ncbi:MAG: hypothetical protein KGZ74_12060 [Chitinophagaceae bacterium]|nr:hypothetical protein [Chitinophagaceae bacterium]